MITLKKIDLIGQALIIGTGILCLFIKQDKWIMMSLLFSLPIGCWQVVSALIHLGLKNKLITLKERSVYVCLVIGFFIILTFLLKYEQRLAGGNVVFLYFFIVSTCLAIWYLTISFRELTVWEKRRLIQLR